MPYVKNDPPWVNGGAPGISAERLNHMETQYDEAKADLDAALDATNGHRHTGQAGDGPIVFVPGAGAFYFAGDAPYSGTALQRTQADADSGTWRRVGPTGSGASVIWPALDSVPAGARAVRLNASIRLYHGSGANSFCTGYVKFRKAGSAVSGDPCVQAIASLSAEESVDTNTIDVQLDASRCFEFLWSTTLPGSGSPIFSLKIYLEGWYI